MKNILIIAESIDVNDSSASKGRVALIKNLCSLGYAVRVLHYTRKNIQLENIECISIKEQKLNILYFLSRTERLFTRLTKISLNKKLENWLGFSFTFFNDVKSISKSLKIEKAESYDLIITLSKGASFRPHYAMLKFPQWHTKWLAYVHDPFPFHYYPRPYTWVQPGYAQKEKFFKKVSEKAAYSGFPSLLLKEWMGSYFPDFLKTGIVIPHQLNADIEIPAELPDFIEKEKFTLLHAGAFLKQRNPAPLMEAYALFLNRNKEAIDDTQLLFIGTGNYHLETLKDHAKKIKTLYFENKSLPFADVLLLQQQVAVNIILEADTEISPFLPGKFPHCVQADKPILLLSPYYSETKRLLGSDYPHWAEANDVEKITSHIETLYIWWKTKGVETLDRKDLEAYMGSHNLKATIDKLF